MDGRGLLPPVQVVDLSSAASGVDLRPNRLTCMLRAAQDFVRSFFDQARCARAVALGSRGRAAASPFPTARACCCSQNPLSQLGLLAMRGGVCVRLTELSASPETQIRRLEAAALSECPHGVRSERGSRVGAARLAALSRTCVWLPSLLGHRLGTALSVVWCGAPAAAEGAASLANALDMSVTLLRNIPKYGHREVLVSARSACVRRGPQRDAAGGPARGHGQQGDACCALASPQHTLRAQVLFASLSTCDPGDVYQSVRAAKEANIRWGGRRATRAPGPPPHARI